MLTSACDAGSPGLCRWCLLRWIVIAFPMLITVSGFATDACASTAGDASYGCSDNMAQKSKINISITSTLQTQSNKHHWNTQIVAQTLQTWTFGASFGNPYHTNEALGDTLGPQKRQSGTLGTILSAQGFTMRSLGSQRGSLGSFGKLKASKWSLVGLLLGYKWAHGGYKKRR